MALADFVRRRGTKISQTISLKMNSVTERSSYLLLSPPSKVWWLTTNHVGYIISLVLSSNIPERFITAHMVTTKNKGSSVYLLYACTEMMCTTTRIWASQIPATPSLASTICYSSGGSYSLAFVTRNEIIHDITLHCHQKQQILQKDIYLYTW